MEQTKKTLKQTTAMLLAMIMFIAGFALLPEKTMLTSNAASNYLTWKSTDAEYKKVYHPFLTYATLAVYTGYASKDPSVFNPKTLETDMLAKSKNNLQPSDIYKVIPELEPLDIVIRKNASTKEIASLVKTYAKKGYAVLGEYSILYSFVVIGDVSDTDFKIKDENCVYSTFSEAAKAHPEYLTDLTLYVFQSKNKTTVIDDDNNYKLITGKYFIKNVSTGTYMNVADGKDTDTTNIGLAALQKTNAFGMNVSAVKSGDAKSGTYIMPSCSKSRVVNPYADTVKDGTNVNLYLKDSSATQKWIWEAVTGGYVIRNAQNKNLVLTASGSNVLVKTYQSGNKAQIWTVEKAGTTITPATVTGKYYIKNNSTGTYMNVAGGKDADKTNIAVASNSKTNAFVMNVTAVTKGNPMAGTHIMPGCSSTRVVNPYADTVVNGTNVNLYKKDSTSTQKWVWEKVSGGYVIRNLQNIDLALTVDGTNVCVKTYSGAKTQIWTLEAVQAATTTKATVTTTTTKATVATTTSAEVSTETTSFAPETTTTAVKTEPNKYGDANLDNIITVADAVAILQFLGNHDKYSLSADAKANADVYNTGDGITGNDALTIQKVDAGLINADDLPVMPG